MLTFSSRQTDLHSHLFWFESDLKKSTVSFKEVTFSPVNSEGLLPLRSFLPATGEDEGEFFLRVCTLGGAKKNKVN